MSGNQVTISGKIHNIIIQITIIIIKGIEPFNISERLTSGVIPFIIYKFRPTGGVIKPISIFIVKTIAIVFTINMEIGLITPPVGLNLYIIKGITPDVSLSEILKGSIPFMIMMVICIIILCIFPEIVTWLPDKLMGKPIGF